MAIGKLHLLVLHLPVALVIAAVLADALGLKWRKPFFASAGYYCIVLGALACIPTVATGLMLIDTLTLSADEANLGEMHETLGIITASVVILAAAVRIWRKNDLARPWGYAYGLLILGSVALVSVTAHYGGLLAFGRDYLSGLF